MVYVRNTIRVHMYSKDGGMYQKIVRATTSQVQNATLPSRRIFVAVTWKHTLRLATK